MTWDFSADHDGARSGIIGRDAEEDERLAAREGSSNIVMRAITAELMMQWCVPYSYSITATDSVLRGRISIVHLTKLLGALYFKSSVCRALYTTVTSIRASGHHCGRKQWYRINGQGGQWAN